MSVEIHNHQMYCTTAEVHFGPECRDDTECAMLYEHIIRTRGKDPREVDFVDRYTALGELRSGRIIATHPNRLCQCNSGKVYHCRINYITVCEDCAETKHAKYLSNG